MFKGDESVFVVADRGSYATESTKPPALLLTLPKISEEVPTCYMQSAHPSIGLLGRQLANIGLITREDVKGKKPLDEVIKQVFDRELTAALGPLNLFTLCAGVGDGIGEGYTEMREANGESENERFHFCMSISDLPTVAVGKALVSLEAIRPGLGETVYAVLCESAKASMGLFTFEFVFDAIPWLYQLDEREDELDESGEEDEMFEGMPTKKDLLEGALFEWAAKPTIRLTQKTVRRILNLDSTPFWAKNILATTLSVAKNYEPGQYKLGKMDAVDLEAVYQFGAVHFFPDDQMERVLDDYIEMCNHSSDTYTEDSHVEVVDLRDTLKFKQWWEGIQAGCRLVGSIDNLLYMLSCQSK